MDYSEINEMKTKELHELMDDLGLKHRRKKSDMMIDILEEKDKRYVRGKQLGEKGKDAITYEVKVNGKKYALKQYKPRKSGSKIIQEAEMQKDLACEGICPKIIDVDTERKYIVMEKLDKHLVDITREKSISQKHQKQLMKIYKKMDEIGVFHGDANPLNYMTKGQKLYVIDFGMSKPITKSLCKKLGTEYPNSDIMTLGMILKFKSMNYPPDSYDVLIDSLSDEQREKFDL